MAFPNDVGTGSILRVVQVDPATGAPAATASAANLAAYSSSGAGLVSLPGQWVVTNNPAAGTRASVTRAAGAAGVRHVLTGIIIVLSASTALAAINTVTINVLDGISNSGVILFAVQVTLTATTLLPTTIPIPPLNVPGSAATAMTVEGTASVGNLMESLTMIGYDGS